MRTAAIAATWLSILAIGGGCERRIEEPPPRTHATSGAEPPSDPMGSRVEPPADPLGMKRDGPALPPCANPTPDKPAREVSGPVPAPGCPADPGPVPELARGKVRFVDAESKPEIAIEVAERDADRQRGLMFRTAMPETEGMLFIFERVKTLSFWMHNTCIPLDMIYVAEDSSIVNIEENTPTLSDQTFPSLCPAKYVVEVNAGWTRKHGVKVGQKVAIER